MTALEFAPNLVVPGRVEGIDRPPLRTGAGWAALAAGLLSAFTIPLIGELPVGELVLGPVAGWAILCAVMNQVWPTELFRVPLFWALLIAETVALVAYIGSDLYRHSSPHDMARGWGRLIMVAVDLVAVAFLFGRSPRNLFVLVVAGALGEVISALTIGPLFGDMWKFGIGAPITILVLVLVPRWGRLLTATAVIGLGALHFALDYRSLGGLCLVTGALTLAQMFRPLLRLWLVPLAALLTAFVCLRVFEATQGAQRATRSDVERSAMLTAAVEAIQSSPFIGHGSWFSNSDVYDNFMRIRMEKAREAHVGGFADPNKEADAMALHSQILVAVAEGGVFGGAFFLVLAWALLRALGDLAFFRAWDRRTPLYTLLVLLALWNLCFSPFSGAQRVYIATACGLLLLLRREDRPRVPCSV